MANWTLGQVLPTGAVVVAHTINTLSDGAVVEFMRDSAGNETTTNTPGPGTPDGNRDAIEQALALAIAANVNFLNIASPTQVQTLTQVQRLTRMVQGLLRLKLNQMESASGT